MASVIVLMINGTADCGTAFSAMSRCREPKEIATTLEFLVAQPMNTGLRRSSDCGPSKHCNQEKDSEKVAYTELNEPEARFVVACSGEARKIAKDFSAAYIISSSLQYLGWIDKHLAYLWMLPPGFTRQRLSR